MEKIQVDVKMSADVWLFLLVFLGRRKLSNYNKRDSLNKRKARGYYRKLPFSKISHKDTRRKPSTGMMNLIYLFLETRVLAV